jgi:DNA processing protein
MIYNIALSLVEGIGHKTAKNLLNKFENAETIFKSSIKDLSHIEGVGAIRSKAFKNKQVLKRAEEILVQHDKEGIDILFYKNPSFPKRLVQCEDAPILLYYKGNAHLNAQKMLAIIGTRKNTEYGAKMMEHMMEQFQSISDLVIISGLALGIDGLAHRFALKNNIPTIGVVAHGLDITYPPSHKKLAQEMLANGGLLSEYPLMSKIELANFPMRNRIVAGLCDASIIVESDRKGGAMITSKLAVGYNREVFAFPGRSIDSRSEGCNELIKKNMAQLIESGEDVLSFMNWTDTQTKNKPKQALLFTQLNEQEQLLIKLIQEKEMIHADELKLKSALSDSKLASYLLQLEMQNIIKSLPGKLYCMR